MWQLSSAQDRIPAFWLEAWNTFSLKREVKNSAKNYSPHSNVGKAIEFWAIWQMICDNYSFFESLWSNVCMVHCEQWADQSGDFYHKTFAKNALGGNIGLISRTHIFLLWVLLNSHSSWQQVQAKSCVCVKERILLCEYDQRWVFVWEPGGWVLLRWQVR